MFLVAGRESHGEDALKVEQNDSPYSAQTACLIVIITVLKVSVLRPSNTICGNLFTEDNLTGDLRWVQKFSNEERNNLNVQ